MTYDPHQVEGPNRLCQSFAVYFKLPGSAARLFMLTIAVWTSANGSAISQTPPPPTEQTPREPEVDPNNLLLDAVKRAVWGPPLSCEVKQQTNMFGQQQIGIGHYRHSGGGEGQLEFGMRFATGRSQLYYEQLSDGRLLWSWANDGQPPRRVYLDRVRQSLGTLPRNPQESPVTSLYLAIGGQAGLLRSLYHRYRWYRIFAGHNGDQPCWEIIGTLRQRVPELTAIAPFDLRPVSEPVHELVPTDARIKLGRYVQGEPGGEFNLVPLQVEYFRPELDEKGKFKTWLRVSKIEYTDIHIDGHFDVSNFTFQDHAANPIDETAEYLMPTPVAAAPPPTTAR
jgi:hypothetical protein